MSHVDEGRLHEYLDALERHGGTAARRGEVEGHLSECAECRALLEEVRRVRTRSSDILSASGPADAAAAPPFEEILARKHARSKRRLVFGMNRLTAVGWAATIVFAVGLGWVARGQLTTRSPVERIIPSAEPMTIRATPSDTGQREEAPLEAAPTRSSEVSGAAADRADLAAEGAGRRQAQPAAPEPEEIAPPVEPEGRQAPAPAPQVAAEGETSPAARDAAPAAETIDSLLGGERQAGFAAEVRKARDETATRALTASRAVSLDAMAGRLPDDWTPVTPEGAKPVLGREPLVIPDLPVQEMAVGSIDSTPAVLVRQQLSSGATLTLLQWREMRAQRAEEPAAPRAAPYPVDDAGTGTAESQLVLALQGGYVVFARAPIPQDSLQALLGRIR